MKITEIVKFDQSGLKQCLTTELKSRGYNPVEADGFVYAAGDVPVMLVAHMDTVHHDRCTIVCQSDDGRYLMSPQGIGGDDRCGIYMVLRVLDKLKCHVLFTEDEEHGCVGAGKFAAGDIKPDLKYIVEFDRKGDDDCVFYQCDNPDFAKFVEGFGFTTASGSCSDISKVAPALGVAAVNLSSGYYNPHTTSEFIDMKIVERNIDKAIKMISTESDKFEYIEKKYTYAGASYGRSYGGWYDDYADDYRDETWWKRWSSDRSNPVLPGKIAPQTKKADDNDNDDDHCGSDDFWDMYEIFLRSFDDEDDSTEFGYADFQPLCIIPSGAIIETLERITHYSWGDYALDENGTLYSYNADGDLFEEAMFEAEGIYDLGREPIRFDREKSVECLCTSCGFYDFLVEFIDCYESNLEEDEADGTITS